MDFHNTIRDSYKLRECGMLSKVFCGDKSLKYLVFIAWHILKFLFILHLYFFHSVQADGGLFIYPKVVMTRVGSGQFFVARVGSGQPFMVWVRIRKIPAKNGKFFNFFPFGSGWKVPGSKPGRPLFYCGSKVSSGRVGSRPISTPRSEGKTGLQIFPHRSKG